MGVGLRMVGCPFADDDGALRGYAQYVTYNAYSWTGVNVTKQSVWDALTPDSQVLWTETNNTNDNTVSPVGEFLEAVAVTNDESDRDDDFAEVLVLLRQHLNPDAVLVFEWWED